MDTAAVLAAFDEQLRRHPEAGPADRVENDAQVAFLRDLGCEFIQGFLFSEPMSADRFASVLGGSSTQ